MDINSKICTLRYWINQRIDTFLISIDMLDINRELRYNNNELEIIQVSTFAMLKTPAGYFRFARELCSPNEFNLKSEKLFEVLMEGKKLNDSDISQMKDRFVNCNLKTYKPYKAIKDYKDNILISRELQYILAEEIIANYLNCKSLLTTSEWCKLIINGKIEIYGLLSSVAEGVNYNDKICKPYYHNMLKHIEPDVQRQLLNLNLLDLICNEVDHGPNNYMLNFRNDKVREICAFDNSHPHAFLPIYNLDFKPYHYQSQIVKNGRIARPYLDKNFVEILNHLELSKLELSLKPLLSHRQIKACIWRIIKLKDVIRKDNHVKLLSKDEWTNETMYEECQSYGNTYLYSLANWWQIHHSMRQTIV